MICPTPIVYHSFGKSVYNFLNSLNIFQTREGPIVCRIADIQSDLKWNAPEGLVQGRVHGGWDSILSYLTHIGNFSSPVFRTSSTLRITIPVFGEPGGSVYQSLLR